MLTDLGLACHQNDFKRMFVCFGTQGHRAPEVVSGMQCCQSDVWSAGAVLHRMLIGELPYESMDSLNLQYAACSLSAKGIMQSLLQADPDGRVGSGQALHLAFFGSSGFVSDVDEDEAEEADKLEEMGIELKYKVFCQRRLQQKWQVVVRSSVMWEFL